MKDKISLPQWIAMEDEAPEGQQIVLCWSETCGIDAMRCIHNENWEKDTFGSTTFASRSGYLSGDVTHWMPLPEYFVEDLIRSGYISER